MSRFLGRSVALALLTSAIALTFTIAFLLITIQLLGGQAAIDEARCYLKLDEECAKQALEEKRQELNALQERYDDLQAIYDRLEKLDFASESFVVFYKDRLGPHQVTTGHRYASLIEPGQFTKGWCYIDLSDDGGVSRDMFVAYLDADGDIRIVEHDDDTLVAADVTRADLVNALNRCHWPEAIR